MRRDSASRCRAHAGSSQTDHSRDTFFVPFGAIVFVAVLPVWIYATSGLEGGLTFGWLGACLWILADWTRTPDRRMTAPRAVILGLGWLVRPELVLTSAAFLVLVLGVQWSQDRWRDRARIVAAMIALPVAYQVFRMGFYGSLVPGTAVAKEGGSANLSRGWDYLLDFAKPYWLWFAALVMLAGGYLPMCFALVERGRRRALLVVLTFAGIGVVNAAYLTLVGGDYLHARLLLPAFFTVCAPVAVIPATRRHLAGLVLVPWAIIAALALRPPQVRTDNFVANGFIAPRTFLVTADDQGWGPNGAARRWFTTPGYYFEGGALQPYRTADDSPARQRRRPDRGVVGHRRLGLCARYRIPGARRHGPRRSAHRALRDDTVPHRSGSSRRATRSPRRQSGPPPASHPKAAGRGPRTFRRGVKAD